MMSYKAAEDRYSEMKYRRCGRSGIMLPEISLGLWQNFGDVDDFENGRAMLLRAFDLGITHFDLANNYGPSPGSAETNFGKILRSDLMPYRDELIISTKAGYTMWPGPYGDWGSRKYIISSLDQSLKRMGLDYVDIFYHHRPDPNTPIEESMAALDQVVRQGKALYVGLSNYSPKQFTDAVAVLKSLGTPCLIEQSKYSMMVRNVEDSLLDTVQDNGTGFIAFSPLAQGLLSDKYINGIPSDSRAVRNLFLKEADITPDKIAQVAALNDIAQSLGMTLAQLAVKWLLRSNRNVVTSVLIGASKVSQIEDIAAVVSMETLEADTLDKIESILVG
ncbi:MAG: aldo/keto reductase [Rikenellaceae bacterium]